jgi:cell division initiation protein
MPYTPVELRHVKLGRSLFGFKRDETERLLIDVADSFEDVWRERGELTDRVHELGQRLDEIRQREALLSATLVSAEKAAVESKEAAKREAELIVAEAHGEARSIMRAAQSERERLFAEARRVESLLRSALQIVAERPAQRPVEVPAQMAPAEAAPPADAPSSNAPPSDSQPRETDESARPEPPLPTLPPPTEHWPRREDTREFAAIRGHDNPPADPAPEAQLGGEAEALPEPVAPQPEESPSVEQQSVDPQASAREFAWGD